MRLLSAGIEPARAADESDRLALLKRFVDTKKRPRKVDGSLFGDDELLSLPLKQLQILFDNTRSEDDSQATGEKPQPDAAVNALRVKSLSVNLAEIFNAENKNNRQ